MLETGGNVISGKIVPAASDERIDVFSPATGEK